MRFQLGSLDIRFGNEAPGDAIRGESLSDRQLNATLPTVAQGTDPIPFKPGAPLSPLAPSYHEPTGYEVRIGENLQFNPDTKKPGARNAVLRNLADNCWAIRIVIEDLKKQARGWAHDVTLKKMEEGESIENRPDIKAAQAWLKKPDGILRFGDWLNSALEEVLVLGTLAVGKRRTLGGAPLGLRVLDAAKIAPIVTGFGLAPPPPAAAFYQFLHGVPERQYTTDELIWRPFNARSWTPYGFGPVEQCLTLVTLATNASLKDNYEFTAGNLSKGLLEMPEGWTPAQREEFRLWLILAMKGNLEARAGGLPVPKGTNYTPIPPTQWQYEFQEFMLRAMAWCVGVNPTAIMKTAGLGRSGSADANQSQAAGAQPVKLFMEELLDEYIEFDLGLTEVTFEWTEETQINKQLELQENEGLAKIGARSINEVRKRAGDPPSDVPEADMLMVLTATGYVPLAGSSEPKPVPVALSPFAGKDNAPPGEPGAPQEPPKDGEPPVIPPKAEPKPTAKAADELRQWKNVAKADRRAGRQPRPFASATLSPAARHWVEKCLADGDVAKAFTGPRVALRWESSERAKPLTRAGVELWQRIYMDLAAPWLAKAESRIAEKSDVGEALDYAGMPSDDWQALVRWLKELFVAGAEDASEIVGVGAVNALAWAEERAAALLGMHWDGLKWITNPDRAWAVSDTVRDTIQADVERAITNGTEYADLAKEIRETLGSGDRALMVARTETGMAYNMGAAANFAAMGVEKVEVSDGNGPTACEECDAVNGETWTIEEAMQNPLEHPNCVRAFIPLPLDTEEG